MSNSPLLAIIQSDPPSGLLSDPSDTDYRRQRLQQIGSYPNPTPIAQNQADDETTAFCAVPSGTGYGTLPIVRPRRARTQTSLWIAPRRPTLTSLPITRSGTISVPDSPSAFSTTFTQSTHYRRIPHQRPISAYDAQLVNANADAAETDIDVRTNGFRVWYSSFTSIDWLHDSIKDSVRFARLRRGKSIRSRVRLVFDKSLGWIIVTVVGFLTAVVAFLVVRAEQWLFDVKQGYCKTALWHARHFCCPLPDEYGSLDGHCPAWRTWSDVFASWTGSGSGGEDSVVQYLALTVIAIVLASTSSLLTINLTASTSFVTRKESGVLSPDFNKSGEQNAPSSSQPKRGVIYYAAGSGIPEIKTILSGFVIHGYLGGRVLFIKALGLALSVSSGLSLGKEGPFVHIASCIGNIVSRYHTKYENNEAKRREILSAACAAGVAVAFGAPIGGTLFSLEEVSYFFPPKVMWRSFFCAMIAAVTLRFLNPFGTGKVVLFQVTYDKDWHAYELIFFILLGVLGGVYGAYFSKLNYRWSRDVRGGTWLKAHPVAEVILVTLVTTVLCLSSPYARMGGTDLVYNLFSECRTGSKNTHFNLCVLDPSNFDHVWSVVRAILVAMIVKGFLTIITFGIKLPAGIFIPTLGVGACAGRIVGIAVQWLQYHYPNSIVFDVCEGDMDCVPAAALSGVTRTTVSLSVIMFELTDTLTYAVPVMLSVLVAKTVADALEPKGIYDLVIELSQLPYLDAKHEYLWSNLSIKEVTDRDVDVIRVDQHNTVESLRDQLQSLLNAEHDDGGFPILRPGRDEDCLRMVGYIGASELEHALAVVAERATQEVRFHTTYADEELATSYSTWVEEPGQSEDDPFDFSVYMDQAPLMIQSNSPLELLHQFFVKLGARYVIVTDTDGDYEGVIDKKTWLAFLSELEEKS
ncbi:chloride channel [Suillus fuscotomentosus]|uniref:Chloride channel n=1 Tax=Suillus fuscotomentosus TaxID=1912939 RepID=A0AAD4E6K0_9AGAM|nr:chloride channel [Suillus fuscotomentosus]KAG1900670.1 chloride channel [Suillus fuscotomentosus]